MSTTFLVYPQNPSSIVQLCHQRRYGLSRQSCFLLFLIWDWLVLLLALRYLIHLVHPPQLSLRHRDQALPLCAHRVLLHLNLRQSILVHCFTNLHINFSSWLDNFNRFMPQLLQKYPDNLSKEIQDFGLQSRPLHTSSIPPWQWMSVSSLLRLRPWCYWEHQNLTPSIRLTLGWNRFGFRNWCL